MGYFGVRFKKPMIGIWSAALLSSSFCNADGIQQTAISGLQHGKILSEFSAYLSSTSVQSRIIFAKNVEVTDPNISISNPWKNAYNCDEDGSDGSAIIIIADTVHVLTACGELNSDEYDEMFIEKQPSTVIPQGSARSGLLNNVIQDLDVIMVPTPATIDTYIVWDGKKFVFSAPLEPEYR
ncbi:hypothetical protein L4C36_12830 [Photobacterium japonica]|uniref:hypothetical protein n=1 Tax=Photobacterium japonica TaxID=2910235 RepID=UPI003D0ABF23